MASCPSARVRSPFAALAGDAEHPGAGAAARRGREARAGTTVGAHRAGPRRHAQATPRVNGMRPITTFAAIPLANSHVASRAARGRAVRARAASVRIRRTRHRGRDAAIAPTARGPTSPASGGNSSE
jgi:hypothetical protein